MTSFQLYIYLSEVETQCQFSLAAAKSVSDYVNGDHDLTSAESEETPGASQAQLFRSLHSFLTHAVVVSRLLWPSTPRKRREEDRSSHDVRKAHARNRGKRIRLALGLQDEEPDRQRTLRDHLEHFDERLDDWVLTSARHNFIDQCVGPPGFMFGPDRHDIMRWFDPTDGSFHFRGERFDLTALAAWVKQIRDRAAQARRYGALTP